MAAQTFQTSTGLEIQAHKHFYSGLWYVVYSDNRQVYAGPFKTKREAIEKMQQEEVGAWPPLNIRTPSRPSASRKREPGIGLGSGGERLRATRWVNIRCPSPWQNSCGFALK
jgi:hypothetical protein